MAGTWTGRYKHIKGTQGARWFRSGDFSVGKQISFMFPSNGNCTQTFELTATDPFTRNLMESNPTEFSTANWQHVVNNVARVLSEAQVSIPTMFQQYDKDGTGFIHIEDFLEILVRDPSIPPHSEESHG